MNSTSRENVSAYEWQGRHSSFPTVNVAVTQHFHLCSWLSRDVTEFPSQCPGAFLRSCVCEYPLRNSGSAWLAGGSLLAEGPEPAHDPFYICTLFNLLYPAFPGLSFQQTFKLRAVERFLNTKDKTHRSVLTLHLMSRASQSMRDLVCLSQGTKIVADFIWVTASALVSYK